MATNPFFNQTTDLAEQNLVEDLIIEAIQIHGIDMVYVPRTIGKDDQIYGEDVLSQFDESYEVEMYIENPEGFGGDGDFLSKFGLEIRDQATLVVVKSRFDVAVDGRYNRPREGDLVFLPLNKKLFEIKFVEHENAFYQLGQLYVYKLRVELFEYTHQEVDTGIPEIDALEDLFSYAQTFTMGVGSGLYTVGEEVRQGATATGFVLSFDNPTKKLVLNQIKGGFVVNATPLVGQTSGASFTISATDTNLFENDRLTNNKPIENEIASSVDFSEDDPFSEL